MKTLSEYTVREDILLCVECNPLTNEQASALLASPAPLADIFKAFQNMETGYMDTVLSCVEGRADELIAKDRTPPYRSSGEFTRETPKRESVLEKLRRPSPGPDAPAAHRHAEPER